MALSPSLHIAPPPATRHLSHQPPPLSSSPSMSKLWHPTSNLLSASADPDAARKFAQLLDHPSQPHTPLTPPLTPASSSTDNLDNHSSPEPVSPAVPRWSLSNAPYSRSHPDLPMSVDISHDLDFAPVQRGGLQLDLGCDRQFSPEDANGSRFLLIRGVPKDAASIVLKDAFKACGEIKGIFLGFQKEHGIIILAFYDRRHAAHARHTLSSDSFFGGSWLDPRYISSAQLRKLLGDSTFVTEAEGELLLTVEGGTIDAVSLQSMLNSFGELRTFTKPDAVHTQAFYTEYHDSRDALQAIGALDNRKIFGVRLRLVPTNQDHSTSMIPFPQRGGDSPRSPQQRLPSEHSTPPSPVASQTQDMTNSSPFVSHRPLSPLPTLSAHTSRRISTGSFDLTGASPALHQSSSEQDLRRRATAAATRMHAHRRDASVGARVRPRSVSESSASPPPPQTLQAVTAESSPEFTTETTAADSSGEDMPATPPAPVLAPLQLQHPQASPARAHHAFGLYPASPVYWSPEQAPLSPLAQMLPMSMPLTPHAHALYLGAGAQLHYMADAYAPRRMPVTHAAPAQVHGSAHGQGHLPASARGALDVLREPPPERNQIDLARIADGVDTRTTVMIKNIPNKLSDRDLIEFIGKVCPRRIDFLYLRMDFQNGCNVGYAFVNFISVQDLLHFARVKLGVKWNMFSSEKVLQMSYANYQGKEALVEKFKNSCVMDERESWRPKIFYSAGPLQGMSEPFPSPTHLRRKERSSQNRGALFVPGPGVAASLGGPAQAHAHSGGPVGGLRRAHQHPSHLARSENR